MISATVLSVLLNALALAFPCTPGLEERKGVQLFRDDSVRLESDTIISEGRELKATVDGCSPMLRRDIDGRITYAQCDCTHFKYHKLRQGPCRHIVALSLKGGV